MTAVVLRITREAIMRRVSKMFFAVVVASLITAKPVAADDYGAIDFGSTGIKRIVAKSENGKMLVQSGTEKSINSGLVKSLTDQGFDEDDVKSACDAVQEHLNVMERTYGVPRDRIWVVISSGLSGAALKKPNGEVALKNLIDRIQRDCHTLNVERISGMQEAKFTFDGNVPSTEVAHSVAVDVGSGNTKIATQSLAKSIDYGTKTLARTDQEKAESIISDLLTPTNFHELNSAQDIYLSGGITYVVAVLLAPEDLANAAKQDGIYRLDSQKVSQLLKSILNAKTRDEIFDAVRESEARNQAAITSINDAQNIFTLPQLQAGAWLLDRTIRRLPKATVINFCAYGQTAYVRGFLQQKAEEVGRARPRQNVGQSPPRPVDPDITALRDEVKDLQQRVKKLEERVDRKPGASDNSMDSKFNQLVDELSALQFLSKLDKLSQLDRLVQIDEKLSKLNALVGENLTRFDAKLVDQASRSDIAHLQDRLSHQFDHLEKVINSETLPHFTPQAAIAEGRYSYDEGLAAVKSGKWQLAANDFTRAVQAEPHNAVSWYLRGVSYLYLNDEATADDSIRRAGQLVANDHEQYARICHAAENIQGPIRVQAERILLVSSRH